VAEFKSLIGRAAASALAVGVTFTACSSSAKTLSNEPVAVSPTTSGISVATTSVATAATNTAAPSSPVTHTPVGAVGADESCATYLGSTPDQKQVAAIALKAAHSDGSATIIIRASIRTFCELNNGGKIADIYHG
jgi:hypothetical protein